INRFIQNEYENRLTQEVIKNWIKKRLQHNLIRNVNHLRLERGIENGIRDNYGRLSSIDMRFIETCHNTLFKFLITENLSDFFRRHKRGGRRITLPQYLKKKIGININTVDECCNSIIQDDD
ncbi:hypothetical protein JYU16_02160, partial [bacterium AH-315-M05]|nr:hypothetical protein [bacterium AH-315-M05]